MVKVWDMEWPVLPKRIGLFIPPLHLLLVDLLGHTLPIGWNKPLTCLVFISLPELWLCQPQYYITQPTTIWSLPWGMTMKHPVHLHQWLLEELPEVGLVTNWQFSKNNAYWVIPLAVAKWLSCCKMVYTGIWKEPFPTQSAPVKLGGHYWLPQSKYSKRRKKVEFVHGSNPWPSAC